MDEPEKPKRQAGRPLSFPEDGPLKGLMRSHMYRARRQHELEALARTWLKLAAASRAEDFPDGTQGELCQAFAAIRRISASGRLELDGKIEAAEKLMLGTSEKA